MADLTKQDLPDGMLDRLAALPSIDHLSDWRCPRGQCQACRENDARTALEVIAVLREAGWQVRPVPQWVVEQRVEGRWVACGHGPYDDMADAEAEAAAIGVSLTAGPFRVAQVPRG